MSRLNGIYFGEVFRKAMSKSPHNSECGCTCLGHLGWLLIQKVAVIWVFLQSFVQSHVSYAYATSSQQWQNWHSFYQSKCEVKLNIKTLDVSIKRHLLWQSFLKSHECGCTCLGHLRWLLTQKVAVIRVFLQSFVQSHVSYAYATSSRQCQNWH
jgi:hypothetical protein